MKGRGGVCGGGLRPPGYAEVRRSCHAEIEVGGIAEPGTWYVEEKKDAKNMPASGGAGGVWILDNSRKKSRTEHFRGRLSMGKFRVSGC